MVALWTEAKLGNRREAVAIPNRRPPEEAIVCPEVDSVKGEEHKGVGNNNSENKSKIKYDKDTGNSITEEVVSTYEATQMKTVLKGTKPDRPETAQVEAANNSEITAKTTGRVTEASDSPNTLSVKNSEELGDGRSNNFT